jgi:RNA-directed DNA polymerase
MDQPLYPGRKVKYQKKAVCRDTKPHSATLNSMAKKHDNLIEQIADWDNLLLAHQRARAGKRDRLEVQTFSGDLWLHLGNIQHHLLAGTYQMGTYRSFVVFEPKRREILAAPFGDRVVQHAVLNILEPIWDACMIEDAFACRPGKGVHMGVHRLQRWVRDMAVHQPLGEVWIAKTDFSGYFKNIRHADLKRIARRKIACPRTLQVLDTIIDSTPGGVGIPVGNLTSQWLANLLGNELDQWIKRELKVKRYLRYMDDCVAIFASQSQAQWFIEQLEARSAQHGLWFSKWSVHRASQGINMLGYRIWPTHKLLRRRAIVIFRRDMRHLRKRMDAGEASMSEVTSRLKSFVAHAKHADTWRLRSQLFNEG